MTTPASLKRSSVRLESKTSYITKRARSTSNASTASPCLHGNKQHAFETSDDVKNNKILKDPQEEIISEPPSQNEVQSKTAEVILPDAPTSNSRRRNSGSKRKSMRRSSFGKGRLSKVVPITTSEDISFEIPEDLSQSERLSQLCVAVHKFSLEKLSQEFPDLEGIQQFRVEANTVRISCMERLANQDMFSLATDTNRLLPNPANETLRHTINNLSIYTRKLKHEFERWQEILEENKKKETESERRFREISSHPIREMPAAGLSAQHKKMLAERSKYNEMMSRLQDYQGYAASAITNMVEVVNLTQQFQTAANMKLDGYTENIYQKTFGEMSEDFPDLMLNALKYKD